MRGSSTTLQIVVERRLACTASIHFLGIIPRFTTLMATPLPFTEPVVGGHQRCRRARPARCAWKCPRGAHPRRPRNRTTDMRRSPTSGLEPQPTAVERELPRLIYLGHSCHSPDMSPALYEFFSIYSRI